MKALDCMLFKALVSSTEVIRGLWEFGGLKFFIRDIFLAINDLQSA